VGVPKLCEGASPERPGARGGGRGGPPPPPRPACCRRPCARAGAQAFELWSVPGQRDPLVRVLYNREELPLDDLPAGARPQRSS